MSNYFSLGRQPKIGPPYPAWSPCLVATIQTAVRVAMSLVRASRTPNELQQAKENDLTNWLEYELCQVLDNGKIVPGFTYNVFEKPSRGTETSNYNGTKISKKPDLRFSRYGNPAMVVDPRQDMWFCECKILDATHSDHDYLYLGAQRFIDGDYAWAMPHAQMIAYVRHSAQLAYLPGSHLVPYLNRSNAKTGNTHAVTLNMMVPTHTCTGNPDAIVTEHQRHFLLTNRQLPGNIELHHLWLQL